MINKKFFTITLSTLFIAGFCIGCQNTSGTNTATGSNVTGDATDQNEITESTSSDEASGSSIYVSSEKDAYIDFDGLHLPLVITLEEFEQFMADNQWTIADDGDDWPNENRTSGYAMVQTNCGQVHFSFSYNMYDNGSELHSVDIDTSYLSAPVRFCGIDGHTTLDELNSIMELEESTDERWTYRMDEYLTVTMYTEETGVFDMSIERQTWNRRYIEVCEYEKYFFPELTIDDSFNIAPSINSGSEHIVNEHMKLTVPEGWTEKIVNRSTTAFENGDNGYVTFKPQFTSSTREEFSHFVQESVHNKIKYTSSIDKISLSKGIVNGYEAYKIVYPAGTSTWANYYVLVGNYIYEISYSYIDSINEIDINGILALMGAIEAVN